MQPSQFLGDKRPNVLAIRFPYVLFDTEQNDGERGFIGTGYNVEIKEGVVSIGAVFLNCRRGCGAVVARFNKLRHFSKQAFGLQPESIENKGYYTVFSTMPRSSWDMGFEIISERRQPLVNPLSAEADSKPVRWGGQEFGVIYSGAAVS